MDNASKWVNKPKVVEKPVETEKVEAKKEEAPKKGKGRPKKESK